MKQLKLVLLLGLLLAGCNKDNTLTSEEYDKQILIAQALADYSFYDFKGEYESDEDKLTLKENGHFKEEENLIIDKQFDGVRYDKDYFFTYDMIDTDTSITYTMYFYPVGVEIENIDSDITKVRFIKAVGEIKETDNVYTKKGP